MASIACRKLSPNSVRRPVARTWSACCFCRSANWPAVCAIEFKRLPASCCSRPPSRSVASRKRSAARRESARSILAIRRVSYRRWTASDDRARAARPAGGHLDCCELLVASRIDPIGNSTRCCCPARSIGRLTGHCSAPAGRFVLGSAVRSAPAGRAAAAICCSSCCASRCNISCCHFCSAVCLVVLRCCCARSRSRLRQLVQFLQRIVDFLRALFRARRFCLLPGLVLILLGVEFQIEQRRQIARRAAPPPPPPPPPRRTRLGSAGTSIRRAAKIAAPSAHWESRLSISADCNCCAAGSMAFDAAIMSF